MRSIVCLISVVCVVSNREILQSNSEKGLDAIQLRLEEMDAVVPSTPKDQIMQAVTLTNPPARMPKRKNIILTSSVIQNMAVKKELFAACSPVTSESNPYANALSPSVREGSEASTPITDRPWFSQTGATKRRRRQNDKDDAWLLSNVNARPRKLETCLSRLQKLNYCDLENSIFHNRVPKDFLLSHTCTLKKKQFLSDYRFIQTLYCPNHAHLKLVLRTESNEIFALVSSKCRQNLFSLFGLKSFKTLCDRSAMNVERYINWWSAALVLSESDVRRHFLLPTLTWRLKGIGHPRNFLLPSLPSHPPTLFLSSSSLLSHFSSHAFSNDSPQISHFQAWKVSLVVIRTRA